ncbi:hypothetical protein EV426DRAFT_592832 [Tirmania nivea]|nr:hypothetical protein EV426DRAFT_592832 [Tirmania nivea]
MGMVEIAIQLVCVCGFLFNIMRCITLLLSYYLFITFLLPFSLLLSFLLLEDSLPGLAWGFFVIVSYGLIIPAVGRL